MEPIHIRSVLVITYSAKREQSFYDRIVEQYGIRDAEGKLVEVPTFTFSKKKVNAEKMLACGTYDLIIADDPTEIDASALYRYLREREPHPHVRTLFLFVSSEKSVWIYYRDVVRPNDDYAAIQGSRGDVPIDLDPDIDYATFKAQRIPLIRGGDAFA
jgi:hypothetical protein